MKTYCFFTLKIVRRTTAGTRRGALIRVTLSEKLVVYASKHFRQK